MRTAEKAYEAFKNDTQNHYMRVLKDDGLYRHLHFSAPGTGIQHFDLITWPGSLCYTGDMGTFVFSRVQDMFSFFRRTPDQMGPTIDFHYWAQKCDAADKTDGIKEYEPDLFREAISNALDNMEADAVLRQEVEEHLLPFADDGYHEAVKQAVEFEHPEGDFPFSDIYECDMKQYTGRFFWCCYAIAWGVDQYDQARKAATSST